MQWRNTAHRYGLTASLLHWIIVAGVVAEYFLAEAGDESESASAFGAMGLHMSLGLTIFGLAAIRLVWRFVDARPPLPTTTKGYEVIAARVVHAAFYVLLFAMPLSGWILASLEGESVTFFGLFSAPTFNISANADLAEEVHEVLFNVMLVLALVHAAAALKHKFIDRDGVLGSMTPRP
jgi:cytochrome b561